MTGGQDRRRSRRAAPDQPAPVRSCVGCRARRPQPELVRVAAVGDGHLAVGRALPGRGAWLCRATAPECLVTALHRRSLDRALRVQLADGAPDALRTSLAARAKMEDHPPDGPDTEGEQMTSQGRH